MNQISEAACQQLQVTPVNRGVASAGSGSSRLVWRGARY
jgi:hypothetical protein